MRLTKTQKEDFVRKVMDDVPRVDYVEKARKAIQAEAVSKMPQCVLEIYQHINLRGYLAQRYIYSDVSGMVGVYTNEDFVRSDELVETLSKLRVENDDQWKSRKELEMKIRAMIYACSTLKTALRALPEFAEYLPRDNQPLINNLPIKNNVTQVVTELMNAGWKQNEKVKT